MPNPIISPTRTVAVLGVAYGGIGAASILAKRLPPKWRVVAIDRHSHANHVYAFPRFSVLPQHAPKAFLPLNNLFTTAMTSDVQEHVDEKKRTGSPLPPINGSGPQGEHRVLQGIVTSLTPNSATIVKANSQGNFDDVKDDGSNAPADRIETVNFDYCVYALGSTLSQPSNVWGDANKKSPLRGSKAGGVDWLKRENSTIEQAKSVLIVGGGALGVQFATDIKECYPYKEVTLLHSRERLMPFYHKGLHDAIVRRCNELGIKVILGERVMEWPVNPGEYDGTVKTVTTSKGNKVSADLVLACTGSKPTVDLLAKMDKNTISPSGRVKVKDTLQIRADSGGPKSAARANGTLPKLSEHYANLFAVGDCADTKAIRAGHVSWTMGAVAARNILRLIHAEENGQKADLEVYDTEEAAIKVTLGLTHYCMATENSATTTEDGQVDLQSHEFWFIVGGQDLPVDA